MVRVFALLVTLLISPAVTPHAAAAPIAVIPYHFDYDGSMTVSATVNGRGPYDFVIDTGATMSIAFQNLAALEGFMPTGAPPRRVLGISGSAELDTYRLGDIALGAAALKDHVGVIIPDWSPPRKTPAGIIGIDFLRQYAVVFDVSERTISLYPHGGIPADRTRKWRSVKLRANTFAAAAGALYTTRGQISRSPATFIIDLGSATTMINYRAAEAMFSKVVLTDLDQGFTTGSRLKDIFDDRTRTRTALLDRIHVGRTTWRNVAVWVKNAPIFDEIGVQQQPFGLLGADLIAAQDFALDFEENLLYLDKPPRQRRN